MKKSQVTIGGRLEAYVTAEAAERECSIASVLVELAYAGMEYRQGIQVLPMLNEYLSKLEVLKGESLSISV